MSGPVTRKDWDDYELELAGAINTGFVQRPDLANKVHKIIERERWKDITDEDYKLLLPSLRLASNLIAAGTDYLAGFLPSSPIHDRLRFRKQNQQLNIIDLNPGPFTDKELEIARSELSQIADEVHWRINNTLWEDSGALGVTRHIRQGLTTKEPWPNLTKALIEESDSMWLGRGYVRRPLLVGIMGQYIEALKHYSTDSEAYLRAMFHAAVTITHEIGHVIWVQDYRDLGYSVYGEEPYIDKYSTRELGFCFEAFLFSGFHVSTARLCADVPVDFTAAAVWTPLLTTDITEKNRPLYRTQYSIPVQYIEQLFRQNFWIRLGDQTANGFSVKAKAALKPVTDLSVDIPPATARVRNWTLNFATGNVEWERTFSDRGETPDISARISRADIEIAKEELRPLFKRVLLLGDENKNPFGEDNDEDFIFPDNYNVSDDTRAAGERIIPNLLINDGVPHMDIMPQDKQGNVDNRRVSYDLTRVEVRFRPVSSLTSLNRGRSHSPDLYTSRKKQKISSDPGGNWDKADRLGPEEYDATNIDEYLYHRRPEAYEGLTHSAARKYCTDRKLEAGSVMGNAIFQLTKLDSSDGNDRPLIERMRGYAFVQAEKYFVEDKRALLKIKRARFDSFRNWAPSDKENICSIQGLISTGPQDSIDRRVKQWLRLDIHSTESDIKLSEGADVIPPHKTVIDTDDLTYWGTDNYKYFFQRHNLPTWGNEGTLRLRVERFRDHQAGYPPDRSLIDHDQEFPCDRTDDDGVELYVFDVAVQMTSVESLKSQLFKIAMIPAHQDLNLYFGNDRANPLKNGTDRSLADYGLNRKWSDLRMIASPLKPPKHEPSPPRPPIYVPKNSNGSGGLRGSHNRRRLRTTERSSPSSISQQSKVKSAPAYLPPVDASMKRDYLIRKDPRATTFREQIATLSRRAVNLDKVIISGGGKDRLRPHLKQVIAGTPSEMLVTLNNIEQVERERKANIDAIVEGKEGAFSGGVVGGMDDNDGEVRPGHMRELFSRLRHKVF